MENILFDIILVVALLNLVISVFGIVLIIGMSSILVKIADLMSAEKPPKIKETKDGGLVDLEANIAYDDVRKIKENWGETD